MKLNSQDKELIKIARETRAKALSLKLLDTGDVGSALITSKGNIYSGACTGFYCGIGSCGEYQAIGSMISNGEKEIKTIVAVTASKVIPPCGKCREMIKQVSKKGFETEVIISNSEKVKLKDLLPHSWGKTIDE